MNSSRSFYPLGVPDTAHGSSHLKNDRCLPAFSTAREVTGPVRRGLDFRPGEIAARSESMLYRFRTKTTLPRAPVRRGISLCAYLIANSYSTATMVGDLTSDIALLVLPSRRHRRTLWELVIAAPNIGECAV